MLKQHLLLGIFLLNYLNTVSAQEHHGHQFLVQTSAWTMHYQHDPEHNNHQELINLVWYPSSDYQPHAIKNSQYGWVNHSQWFLGAATFKNSFSQQTYYGYFGGRYRFNEGQFVEPYLRVTGGLLHGYRGKYQHKVPLNQYETAPVIVPSIGVDIQNVSFELVAFAASGVMLNVGYYFR